VNLGHAVPTNARALRIVGFFPITRAPPRGFAATDLPLFKVKYLLPDCSASVTAISSYSRIHARYPREICDYFMSVTVFKKPGKPIKTTIDIGQNKVNGAFSDETNFCFIVDQDAESVAPAPGGDRIGAGPRRRARDDARRQVKWPPDLRGGVRAFATTQTYTINNSN